MPTIEEAYDAYIKTRFPLPSEAQIVALEKRMQSSLPKDYRQFILEYNGGFFTEPIIPSTHEDRPRDRLTVLYGINASHPSADLASDFNLALFEDNMPVTVLPIGYTLMGNLLYMITHEEDSGVVGMKLALRDDYFILASDIASFFAMLQPRK